MTSWLDQVAAVIEAWYPGQEGGTALADILFGDVNPSGRLPVTFERRAEDNPGYDSYYPEPGTKRIVYKEGVFVGYRGYQRSGVKPLFPFGFGLSYTAFKYGNLAVSPIPPAAGGASSGPRYEVAFDVTNIGTRPGADVAQLYVAQTQVPVKAARATQLEGFAKVALRPGETRRLTVTLDSRALSDYDVKAKQWRVAPGSFEVLVGRSSEQIELRGPLTAGGPKAKK
jgi:beta-glucosidase